MQNEFTPRYRELCCTARRCRCRIVLRKRKIGYVRGKNWYVKGEIAQKKGGSGNLGNWRKENPGL